MSYKGCSGKVCDSEILFVGEHQYLNWREHMLKRTITRFREDGAADIFSAIRKRLAFRKPSQLRGLKGLLPLFRNKYGLEVGGPSSVFKAEGLMPLYQSASRIDGCNFSNSTTWEGQIQEGMYYHVARETGYQFIAEAADLKMICSNKYDFLLASHCLEHVANPLRAVSEWSACLRLAEYLFCSCQTRAPLFLLSAPGHRVQSFVARLEEANT